MCFVWASNKHAQMTTPRLGDLTCNDVRSRSVQCVVAREKCLWRNLVRENASFCSWNNFHCSQFPTLSLSTQINKHCLSCLQVVWTLDLQNRPFPLSQPTLRHCQLVLWSCSRKDAMNWMKSYSWSCFLLRESWLFRLESRPLLSFKTVMVSVCVCVFFLRSWSSCECAHTFDWAHG